MNEAAQKPREGSQQFPLIDAIQHEAKAYQYRGAPVLPFWPGWGWEKTQTFKVSPPPPPPQYCFRAELGLVHSCHRRGCAFLAFLHCPSAQCKPSTQGYSRTENYFLLKPPFVCQLARSFHLQQHYAHEKEFGEKKRNALMNFLFKDFNVFRTLGDLSL